MKAGAFAAVTVSTHHHNPDRLGVELEVRLHIHVLKHPVEHVSEPNSHTDGPDVLGVGSFKLFTNINFGRSAGNNVRELLKRCSAV